MKTLPVVLFVAIAGSAAKLTENRRIFKDLHPEASSNSGLIGIASVAGITSRNGRVSSAGGIKFFPESGSDVEYFYPLEYSSENDYSYPFTVLAQRDGKYAKGTVHTSPGYISASASSGFGSPRTESRIEYNPSGAGQQRSFNQYFFQPQPEVLGARNLQTWFPKDFFQGFQPSAPEVIRNGWLVPDFNPFLNFWR